MTRSVGRGVPAEPIVRQVRRRRLTGAIRRTLVKRDRRRGGGCRRPTLRVESDRAVDHRDEAEAVRVAAGLLDQGVLLPAIRYPTVARGSARLRLTVSADHTADDLTRLCRALASAVPRFTFRVPQ